MESIEMPSTYTEKLYNGERQTFEEFVLSCARMMIYDCAELPDTPVSPAAYYYQSLQDAQKAYNDLRKMGADEILAAAKQAHQQNVDRYVQRCNAVTKRREAHRVMAENVHKWEPPIPDLVPLKDAMQKQLDEFAKDVLDLPQLPVELPPGLWWLRELDEAERAVMCASKAVDAAERRAQRTSHWITVLREDLQKTRT